MTEAERMEKFMGNACRVLGQGGAQKLLDLLSQFRTLPNVGSLIKATVPPDIATARSTPNEVAGAAK